MRSRTHSNASITVLPVVRMRASSTPSASKASRALAVGAKWAAASTPVSLRLASSGQGESRLPVRSPASTWPTGTFS